MRQTFFTVAVGVSAVLFVAAVALWVRSYWWWDQWVWDATPNQHVVGSYAGGAAYARVAPTNGRPVLTWPRQAGYVSAPVSALPGDEPPAWSFAGFRRTDFGFGSDAITAWQVPYWAPAVLSAALPAAWAWTRPRRSSARGFLVVGAGPRLGP